MTLRRKALVAVVLWLAFAFVVWNVVFDRMMVLAGRRYVHAAAESAQRGGPYLLIDNWMRPATTHAAWTASSVAGVIAAVGVTLVLIASRRQRSKR